MATAAAAATPSLPPQSHATATSSIDHDGHMLAERARHSAQALLLQWSATDNDRSSSAFRESAALQQREQGHNFARVVAKDLQQWSMFVPSGWTAARTGVDVLGEWSTPTNVYFGRAGGTFLWKSEPPQTERLTKSLATAAAATATVRSTSPKPAASQRGASAVTRESPSTGAYGLTEEELRYFGIPVPGDNDESAAPSARRHERKENLLAQLRGERPLASPRHSTEGKPAEVFATAAAGGRKPVIIRKTKITPMAGAVEKEDVDEAASLRFDDTRLVDQIAEPPPSKQAVLGEFVAAPPASNSPRGISAVPAAAAAAAGPSPSSPQGRERGKSFLKKNEKGIDQQFKKPGHCDATHIATLVHMFATSRALTTEKGAQLAGRRVGDVIETIDLSGTRLGKLGRWTVPIGFNADGSPILRERMLKGTLPTRAFWPDEQLAVLRAGAEDEPSSSDADVFTSVALRSVALTYVAPALYVHRPGLFRVKKLVAVGCDLCDEDAVGLASVLRLSALDKESLAALGHCECVLESIDLSDNHITNVGAEALKKSIKYHPKLRELNLRNNPINADTGVLNEIKRRLRNNRMGIPNLGRIF